MKKRQNFRLALAQCEEKADGTTMIGECLYFGFQTKWSKLESNTHRYIKWPITEKIVLKVLKEQIQPSMFKYYNFSHIL
jgi:hypothetical protein